MTDDPKNAVNQADIEKAIKTAEKRQEKSDCLKLLKIIYEEFGYPAGCKITNESSVYVPANHLINAKAIRKELLYRQISGAALYEHTLALFREVIVKNRLNTTYIIRERINNFIGQRIEKTSQEPKNDNRLSVSAYPQDWSISDVLTFSDKDGNHLKNDMKESWIIRKNEKFYDVISGKVYDTLIPISFKER